MEALNKRTKKKPNVGGKRKRKERTISVEGNLIAFGLICDEQKKTFSVRMEKDVNIDEQLAASLFALVHVFYEKKGYQPLSDKEEGDSTEWNRKDENAEKITD